MRPPRSLRLATGLVLAASAALAAAAAAALGAFVDGAPAPAPARRPPAPLALRLDHSPLPDLPPAGADPAAAPAREPDPAAAEPKRARADALAALDTALIDERQPPEPAAADVFARRTWAVPPPPPPPPPPAGPPPPPPPPQAPALPFKYMGMLEDPAKPTLWYLAAGDRLVVASTGETIDRVWRVDGARDARLMFTYLPLEQRLSLAIGGPQ